MNVNRHSTWTRREVLRGLSAAGLLGLGTRPAAAEPPPETGTIRMSLDPAYPALCWAPKYLAKELLMLEGFTDVQFVPYGERPTDAQLLADDVADIAADFVTGFIGPIDKGQPVLVLSGMHPGCTEVFASDRVPTIRDLKGKRIAILAPGGAEHVFLSGVVAYVGLDPSRDIEWVEEPDFVRWGEMLAAGEVDVVSTFPPHSYAIREAGLGHVILNTTLDDPWRHYFCCMLAGRSDFVRKNPVATKRALRALVKAQQACSLEPERIAKVLVERGATDRIEYASRLLSEIPYDAWRTHDPAATMRFFSLRLRDAGLVKATPREIIARGSDFRFLDELRRELKA